MHLVPSIRRYGLPAILLAVAAPVVLRAQPARAAVPRTESGQCGEPVVVPEPAAVLLLILEHKDSLALDSAQTERISTLVGALRLPPGSIVALDGPLGPRDGAPARKEVIRRAPADPGKEPPVVIDSTVSRRIEEAHRARDEALELLTPRQRRKLIEIEMGRRQRGARKEERSCVGGGR